MLSRKFRKFFFFFLFLIAPLVAQVAVDLSLERSVYLAYEPLFVTVSIHNLSGNTLFLANEEDQPWLSFHLETEKGTPLSFGQHKGASPISLAPGATWSRKLDLLTYYPLEDFGNYRLSAVLFVPALHRYFHSSTHLVEITEGHLLSEQSIGVPARTKLQTERYEICGLAAEGALQKRKVKLLSHRRSDHTDLYLRIEDPDRDLVLCTYSLGRIVSPSEPEMLFDKKNQIHILQQEAPGIFFYTQLDLQGKVIERQSWSALPDRPKLITTSQGSIHVAGGTMLVDSHLM